MLLLVSLSYLFFMYMLFFISYFYFLYFFFFFFQAEDGIRDTSVTGFRRVLFRSRFLRTSRTTLPSLVSSMMGYQAPRRSTSATLSRQRAHPRGIAMSGANLAHPARFRYAHRSEERRVGKEGRSRVGANIE